MLKAVPAPALPRTRRFGPAATALAMGIVLAALVLALHSVAGAWQRSAAPATAKPAAPLIVRAHHSGVSGLLAGGVTVRGGLYPTLPGANTLRLLLRGRTGPLHGGRVDLVVTMPGMPMAPIKATLTPTAGGYRGAITLPMFGAYRAQVVVHTPGGHLSGVMPLVISLPRP